MEQGADGSTGNPYLIGSVESWDFFCDCIEDPDLYLWFTWRTVALTADIGSAEDPVTRMAGSAENHFRGQFEGNGHTLTVNIVSSSSAAAPFYYVEGYIRGLKVEGSVSGRRHSAGLACFADLEAIFEYCVVSTDVSITGDTQGYMGGIVGHGLSSDRLVVASCVFNGSLTSSSNYVGGLVGWTDSCNLEITECLFAGSVTAAEGGFHPVFCHAGNQTVTYDISRTYYTVMPTVANTTNAYKNVGEYAYVSSTAPAHLGSLVVNRPYMTVYANGIEFDGTYYCRANTADFSKTGDNYYIYTAEGWNVFCDCLANNLDYNRFSGRTVYLANNISVTRSAGYSNHDFCGVFDGQNKTLNFTLTSSEDGAAPFAYVCATKADPSDASDTPACIKNLNVVCNINSTAQHASGLIGRVWGAVNIYDCKVTGTITTSEKYAAGFIGQNNCTVKASIEGCVSGVTIKSSVSGDGTHGGFVAQIPSSSVVTNIKNSVFNGKLVTTNGTVKCAGFIGWYGASNITVENCVFAPAAPASGETAITDGAAFVRWDTSDTSHAPTVTNCYYTQTLGYTAGKQTRKVLAGSGVSSLTVSPIGSPVASYANTGVSVYASGKGIKCGSAFYFGNGDSVSLTLTHAPAPEGYEFTGYTVNAGTLTGSGDTYTLLLPDSDVTVTAVFAPVGLLGDVDGDGEVSFLDVSALSLFLTGEGALTEQGMANADIDGDGEVSFLDITALYLLLIGE